MHVIFDTEGSGQALDVPSHGALPQPGQAPHAFVSGSFKFTPGTQ
jgi:hypothetical protein